MSHLFFNPFISFTRLKPTAPRLKNSHVWYNRTLEYIDGRVAAGKAVLIAPDEPLQISRVCHDPNVMQRVYDIGRKAGETADLTFA